SLDKAGDFKYVIEVYDAHLNKQTIEIPLKYQNYKAKTKAEPKGKYIDYLRDYAFEHENVSVEWDARTFFEDAYLDINFLENGIQLHKDEYPLQKNINIKILVPEDYPHKDQTFIGLTSDKRTKYF